MTIIELVRLILKHLVLLIIVPLLLATMVIFLTMNPTHEYSSHTVLYTGLATGSSIEMDKKFNYQATNTAFDNLINIIKSRETQEEVAITSQTVGSVNACTSQPKLCRNFLSRSDTALLSSKTMTLSLFPCLIKHLQSSDQD